MGCRSYQIEFGGIKIGKWIVPSDNFRYDSQVTYYGEFKHCKKVNKWDIFYKDYGMVNFQEFCVDIMTMKVIEQKLESGLSLAMGSKIILKYISVVNIKTVTKQAGGIFGIEMIGRNRTTKCKFFILSSKWGRTYDEIGNGFKMGNWIELGNRYLRDQQIIIYGEYQNGKRFGKWIIQHEKNQIGGGMYDVEGNGFKIGYWIEITKMFNTISQIIQKGKYQNGNKGVEVNLSKIEKLHESPNEY